MPVRFAAPWSALRRPVIIALALYAGYLALMTLVAMPLLNWLAPRIYHEQTGRELHFDHIAINPFNLSVSVHFPTSTNPDGSPFWSADLLRANLSLASLWRWHPVLDELWLTGLDLQVDQTARDRWSFSDIIEHIAARAGTRPEPAEATEPFEISINWLLLGVRHLGLRAPHLSEPLAAEITGLTVTVANFTTVPPEGYAPSPDALPPLAAGHIEFRLDRFRFDSLRAPDPWSTHIDGLRLVLDDFTTTSEAGQPYSLEASMENGGRLQWQGELSLAASRSSGQVRLDNLDLSPVWSYLRPQLRFDVTSARIDVGADYQVSWSGTTDYRLHNGRAVLRGLQLRGREDKDTGLDIGALTIDGIRLDGSQHAVAIASVDLKGLRLTSWNDEATVGLVEMLSPPPADDPPSGQGHAALPAGTAPSGTSPSPPANADWQLEITTITVGDSEVRWRASQLDVPELVVAPLTATVGNLRWPEPTPATVALRATINDSTTLEASGELTPATLDGRLDGKLDGLPLPWGNRLLARELTARLAGGELGAHWQLELAEGSPMRLAADGEINRFELQRTPGNRKLLAWNRLRWEKLLVDLEQRRVTLARVALAAPWTQFRINADGTTNFQQLARPPGAGAPAADRPEPVPVGQQQDWQVLVDNIRLDDGRLDFRDVSIPLPFRAVIGDFGGVIRGLGSAPDQVASVDLTGTVDGYAPVTLAGTASPLSEPPALDLTLDFNNIDLATLTPYSGTYAGYAIDRGQLTVQLAYTLENNRIKGRNRVVIDQLVLGEKIESPKAVDLPLRLAIALLTDENGVMDLGVDITGNLDDPQFDLGDIIWKAFRNVIVKAATAPFRLLAGLVGGGDEKLGEIDFAPGSSELDEAARDRLAKLKEALDKRPALSISLNGHVDPARDGEALRRHQLTEMLLARGLKPDDIETRSRRWRNAIEDLYEKLFPDSDIGDRTAEDLLPEVTGALELKPARLSALASQRALAAKRVLVVDLGMAPERVFISGDSGSRKEKVDLPRVTMSIDGR